MSSSKFTLRLIGAFAALAALALAVSCQGFFPPAQIESITIQPTTATVPLNGTFQMQAFGVDTTGNQLGSVTNKVQWLSSDPSIISIGASTGLMTGQSLGSSAAAVTITASYQALAEQTATATVCVEGSTDLTLNPQSTTVSSSEEFPYNNGGFEAFVQSGGQQLNVTTGVAWTSSNTSLLTITGGIDPAEVTLTPGIVTSGQTPVTVTATYACDTSSQTVTETINVTP